MDRITRAGFGGRALQHGTPDWAENDDRTNVVDTLANIMHYCERHGISLSVWEAAREHFEAERYGE